MYRALNIFVFIFIITISSYSQAPDLINYQAVLRDAGGQILSNTNTNIKINIRESSSNGNTVYSEEHNVNTTNFGNINFTIGQGLNSSGTITGTTMVNPGFGYTSTNLPLVIAPLPAAQKELISGIRFVQGFT